jgi:hypothetical protein
MYVQRYRARVAAEVAIHRREKLIGNADQVRPVASESNPRFRGVWASLRSAKPHSVSPGKEKY